MTTRRWLLLTIGVLVVAVGCGGGAVLFVPAVQDRLLRYFVVQSLEGLTARNTRLYGDDALKVLLCGTSAPVADPDRAKDCTAVFAGGKYYLVDAGPDSSRNLALWNLEDDHLGAVFLTHYQSDDIGDLGEVNMNAWLYGHQGRLPVYGPPGVDALVDGFNQAYARNDADFTALSGARLLPPGSAPMQASVIPLVGPATPQKNRLSAPLHFGDLTVTAIEVDHAPVEPAYGYRFDYHGRSVVISGDTRYHPPLAVAAQGADVLVHKAQSVPLIQLLQRSAGSVPGYGRIATILGDIQGYHTDPRDAARIANEAGVRLLIFNHISPRLANFLVTRMFLRGVSAIRPRGWMIGADGTFVTLPVGSTDVRVSHFAP